MKILVGDLPLAPRPDAIVARDVETALDALHAHRRDRVLVVAEPEVYEHAARVVRNAVAGPDVTLVVLDGFDTARLHVAAALCELDPEDYGLARHVAVDLGRQVHTRLALTGLGRLSSPAPTLGQQIAGWWPATRFEVDVPAGTVARVREFSWASEPHLIAIRTGVDPRGALTIDDGAGQPELTLPTPARRPAYASRIWAEQSVAPRGLGASVAGLCAGLPHLECPMCGRRRCPDLCLWCGSHERTAAVTTAAAVPANESGHERAARPALDWTIPQQPLTQPGATR